MYRSMVDIHSVTAEIRRGKEKKERRNHRAKIQCLHLLRRAAIKKSLSLSIWFLTQLT